MKSLVKDLWLAVIMILGASALLLLSDLEQRQGGSAKMNKKEFPSIAIMQVRSTPLLDNHVAGVMDRLTELGYIAPDKHNVKIFNPQGDLGTANTIAREIANGPYNMVITSSTVSLQIFAKANQTTQKLHVFGAVTDPAGTGVGITGPAADQHPPYLAGIGTFQPVKRAFQIVREFQPKIKKIGVVWNPGEQCSEACLREARQICSELGIELVEAIATNTSEVSEAARSLMAKGVEAVWIGGDTVAIASASMIISLAKQAGIPVFTNDPVDAEVGALFGIGANYHTVGVYTADMAAAIFRGKKPSEFRIENVIPELLGVNNEVLLSLGKSWKMNETINKILQKQDSVAHAGAASSPGEGEGLGTAVRSGSKAPFRLRIVLYSETEFAERCREGLIDGIKKAGLAEGKDYELIIYNAQGDMSTLSSIMTTVKADRVDLLMVVSTPALQAALRQAGAETKIVFTGVGDAVKAGAGKSETDHLPNVTGITTRSPFDGMAKMIKETLPAVKHVGTLFTPAEINSVLYKDWFKEALKQQGIELTAIPVTSSADVPQSAAELCRNNIQVVCQVVDNLTRPGFALISRKAAENNLPVYVFDSDQFKDGEVICLSRDYYDAGLEAAEMAVSVLKGTSPAQIPFANTKSEKLLYNKQLAEKFKLNLSEAFLKKAIIKK
ncbi:MAG: ABC transporter substrate-binding protein [Mangrovibacterium sp.]